MSRGFFTSEEIKSKSRPKGKVTSCASCGLYREASSPKMKPFGNFKKRILNIGEAPGETEDKEGKQWQGKTGRLLQRTYRRLGIDLFEDCLNINAINCRSFDSKGSNRAPSLSEIECCRRIVLKVIDTYKPHLIVLLGNSAIQTMLGHRWQRDLGGISKWRGWTIPDRDFDAWICPTFHPSYIERDESGVAEPIWVEDLKNALAKVEEDLPKYRKPKIEIIIDLSPLNNLKTDRVSIDYETTGIKPHAKGHRIVCASVAYDANHAYAFMMPKTRKECRPFLDLLANYQIGKMAHSMKFEEAWSINRCRQPVVGWEWDSMLAAHLLDNRPYITSLKFQTYVIFGIIDYESEVSEYLRSGSKDGNSLNRIMELISTSGGAKKLLEYCGHDTIYEFRLALVQQDLIDYDFLPF